jgi:plasmid stabilization system protein ParE
VSRYILDRCVFEELAEIWQYIANDDEGSAWRVVDSTFETFELLTQSPKIGTRISFKTSRLKDARFFPVSGFHNYLVFYTVQDGYIYIHHVFHGARDLKSLLK